MVQAMACPAIKVIDGELKLVAWQQCKVEQHVWHSDKVLVKRVGNFAVSGVMNALQTG